MFVNLNKISACCVMLTLALLPKAVVMNLVVLYSQDSVEEVQLIKFKEHQNSLVLCFNTKGNKTWLVNTLIVQYEFGDCFPFASLSGCITHTYQVVSAQWFAPKPSKKHLSDTGMSSQSEHIFQQTVEKNDK